MFDPAFISSGVDVRKIRDHDANRFFARYTLGELQKMSQTHGFTLLFVMDGAREAIYAMEPRVQWEVSKLNEIAGELAGELGLDFVDLQAAFADDYGRNGERFEFPYDWHWNARGNLIVAEVLERELVTRGWVDVPPGNGNPSAVYACSADGADRGIPSQRAAAPASAVVR